MPAAEAARLGDQIGHSSALAGLIVGAVAAAVIAVAVVAVVGTGGVAGVAVGAGIAAAGAGGGLGGAYIGELIPTSPTGAIQTGSFDTLIGGLPLLAARAGDDTAVCSGMVPLFPHGTPLIAQGSAMVLINNRPASRKGDKLVCGAAISQGCASVFIGGPTVTVLPIESEVPSWLRNTLLAVMLVGAVIATGGAVLAFGVGPALGGLVGGLLGGFGLGAAGHWVGGKIGGAFGNAELGARIGEVAGGFFGGLAGGVAGARIGGMIGSSGGPPQLPEFDGKTSGVLVPTDPPGDPVPFKSGPRTGARYPFSQADGHVETQAANWMQENGVKQATFYHNNPNGTCGNCDYYLPTFLEEGSVLTVVPPTDAVAPTPRWVDVPKTYTGNSNTPY